MAVGTKFIEDMDVQYREFLMNEQLPDWAERNADPKYLQPMQNLCTRDGTKVGNATIKSIVKTDAEMGYAQYAVVTDAATHMILTHTELLELFTPGRYIVKKFPNPNCYLDPDLSR